MQNVLDNWISQLVLGQARHLVTALFSMLAAKDYISGDQVQAGTSAAIVLMTLAFSAWDKVRRPPQVTTVVPAEHPTPAGLGPI